MAHIDTSPVIRGSLWIPPHGEALHALTRLMREMRERAGGPQFRPHLTLLGGLERTQASAEVKLKHYAARIRPFPVRLRRLAWSRDYFRCLYVTVEPTDELAAAQRLAYEVFEMNPPPPYEPHVSLLYGDLDEALKVSLAHDAGADVNLEFEAHAVQLVDASSSLPVTAWRALAERRLGADVPASAG